MPATYRSILLILPVGKKYLIIFPISLWLYIILYRAKFVHCLVVDDRGIKIINKTWCLERRVGKAYSKSRIISTGSNDVFTKVYSAMICKIDTLLYGIKLSTNLSKAFGCRQSRICGNDISKAKCLPFSQIKTLLLEVLKK